MDALPHDVRETLGWQVSEEVQLGDSTSDPTGNGCSAR